MLSEGSQSALPDIVPNSQPDEPDETEPTKRSKAARTSEFAEVNKPTRRAPPRRGTGASSRQPSEAPSDSATAIISSDSPVPKRVSCHCFIFGSISLK